MASNFDPGPKEGQAWTHRHAVHTRQTASEREIQFLLHTGLVQPLRVEVCFEGRGSFPLENEDGNIWSSKVMPLAKVSYSYRYYTDSLDSSKFQQTPQFQSLPSLPNHVHHDILLPNLPTSYVLGLVFHLQDIYNTKTTDVQTKISEILHLLNPFGEKKLKLLRNYLPYDYEKLKTNVLMLWIIQSIRNASLTSQLTVLSVLVAHLNPDLFIINAIEDAELKKLIGSLHGAHKRDIDAGSEDKLKTLVKNVLTRIRESHWLYVVLYCYPLFDGDHVQECRRKLHGQPPSSQCISATLLPRLQEDRFTPATKKILEDIEELKKKGKLKASGSAKEGLLKNQSNDDHVRDPLGATGGTTDSAQDKATHKEIPHLTEENAVEWMPHSFCVLLEAEVNIKEIQLSIEEEGCNGSVHPQTCCMTLSNVTVPFSKKTWWKAHIDIQLPEKPKYTYKYSYVYEYKYLVISRRSSSITERGKRTIALTVHKDIFNYNLTPIQKIIGYTRYELELHVCGVVNKDNITQYLFDDSAKMLLSLSTETQDKSFLKDVQLHILSLIDDERNTDAQIIFLASLLGVCSLGTIPSLAKVSTTILAAFQNCMDVIRPCLEKQQNKDASSCLLEIVIGSVKSLQGSWLHLVSYSYPALSASKLCSVYYTWPYDAQTADQVNEEEVLSTCIKHFDGKDSERLLSFVFQSITDVKLLLQVLNRLELAVILQDEHGYRGWVKVALQKRMQSMKHEDVHDIWKEVAETDVRIMKLLAKELVLESLAHSRKWSNDATQFMRSLLSDDGFWQTSIDDGPSDSFLKILDKLLEQQNVQAGIDLFLEIISKQWITKWLSLEELQRLTETMFEKQLQSRLQPAQVMHSIYVFLSTVHSIQWFKELSAFVEHLNIVTLDFISEKNQLKTLLEVVYRSSKSAHANLSDVGMTLVVRHLILSIRSTKMTTSHICELLKPYAPNGIIDLHSRNAVDVLLSFVETKSEDQDNVFKILQNSNFWQLIFKAEGQMLCELHNNKVYQAVVHTLSSTEQDFLQKNVTVWFINKLERLHFRVCLEQLCKIVNTKTDSTEEKHQTFKEPLDILETQQQILHRLETFLVFCRKFKYLSAAELKTMEEELHLRRLHVDAGSKTRLKSLVEPEYFGFLKPFLETAKKTFNLSDSTVFFNICLSFLEIILTAQVDSDLSSDQDTSSDSDLEVEALPASEAEPEAQFEKEPQVESLKLDAFSSLVSSKCLPAYSELCSDIGKECLITVRNMKIMFAGVTKEEELKRELQIMQIHKSVSKQSLDYLKSWIYLKDFIQYSQQLQCLFETFEVPEQKAGDLLKNIDTLLNILEPENDGKTIDEVHRAVKSIQEVDRKFGADDWCTIGELIHSKDLILFLKPIIDDDLRNLTDAVEERSDSLVNESTVSDLIEVQRYMGSFLRIEVMDTPEKLISAITKSKRLEIKNVSEKIKTCNEHFHALKNLYNNIAQRGEMTKKIIRNALEKGSYEFILSEGGELCTVSMSYTRDDETHATYEQDELNDLRSRALLMVNSRMSYQPEREDRDKDDGHLSKKLQEFIQCVDEVNEIVELCSRLANSGHYHYRQFRDSVRDLESLLSLKARLQREDSNWRVILKDARSEFYFLNFFHARQLWLLDQFFRGKIDANTEVVNLFHFANPDISVDTNLREHYETIDGTEDVRMRVFQIGAALQEVFSEAVTPVRDIVCHNPHQKATVDSTVKPGTVFVAELDKDSTNSIPVLMTLLKNTTGRYPQANHVLFCHLETTWEEVFLLLERCRKASELDQNDLYALINVEQLTTEIQFMLVDEVRRIQEEEFFFLLAIICRGGCHHHIIDQFSPHYTHQIQGMTSNEMNDCLEQGWPDVEVITSEVPGLGKSEYIACRASEKGKSSLLFPMGGPQTKTDLVRQLLRRPPSEFQLLHIDIRTATDPSLIDSFIFELLVVGMVVAGTFLCEINTTDILIEIANTQQNQLRDSLTNCCNFKRRHIEWDNYGSFLVSGEVNSPVQVVCNYLKAVKDGSLDSKQITFSSSSKGSLLPEDKCRQLLRSHFSPTSKMAFTTVNMFLNVLATELKKLSASHFFTEEALHVMLGNVAHCVRSDVFKALDAVAQEFSSRSVETGATQPMTSRDAAEALHELQQGPSVTAKKMVARVKGMVQWADSNHLMVVFNQQDTQTLSPLYRLLSQVPQSVKNLFEQQLGKKLPDYQEMSQEQLQTVLEKICRNTRDPFPRSKLGHLDKGYALTPDNLMKMVLIHMRIKSRIPVVIMGETGCGKTTLITYLARVCEIPFYILNFHAGIEVDTIIDFIRDKKKEAEGNLDCQIWCFLDEINTCDHLGLLSEVICHQSCLGEPLPVNLIFLAACNPYSLRQGDIQTAGLTDKLATDEQSKLVYRVNPLPEAMMDYVWDYGALNAKDEEAYTERMIKGNTKDNLVTLFVNLLTMSQKFIKDSTKNNYSVSLRDVNRCKHLAQWMTGMLKDKKPAKVPHPRPKCACLDSNIRAIILSLAHCYHSRLTSPDDRKLYREEMSHIFEREGHLEISEQHIEEVIKCEQLDILNRMEMEEGIAKNEALRENVFVVLISILNRIPVFLVGKPGCSKSLSMQLIRSSLRGPDSKDKYFKKVPAIYVVSYQGSESSTSEGIIKVFEKAKRYKEHNSDIIPVVLLDEIGLAENSSFNPLKVLHSLLEPSTGDFPEMAVVGISNWALDAAKMNRAVHISRPEPNAEDLFETAKSIRDENANFSSSKSKGKRVRLEHDQQLKKLAEAYHYYHQSQARENFHGLRDYYSLIKSIALSSSKQDVASSLEIGLLRNFGGNRQAMSGIMNNFMDTMDVDQSSDSRPSTIKLIEDNLEDRFARHLMLITSGDSALSIIEEVLSKMKKRYISLLGSRFDDDLSEEYNYRILSEIILCMEEGYILVLRDLDNVYSSLYDMLNQNYTIVGKKRHCRVALGAYSNPMCQVHQDFRCIVVIDQQNVDYSDPPLLNRFEKQTLTFMDVVNDQQKSVIDSLRQWVEGISTIPNMQFSPNQAFLGYHNDTLPSLVFSHCRDVKPEDMNVDQVVQLCKNDLVKIAPPDAVLRSSKSNLAMEETGDEVSSFQDQYFTLQLSCGLRHYLQSLLSSGREDKAQVETLDEPIQNSPLKLIVYTFSSIHTDLSSCLVDMPKFQVEKLSKFKSERQLNAALQQFKDSTDELFILQCKTSLDAKHMLLAKCLIDRRLAEYRRDELYGGVKHACIIVHVERDQNVGGMTASFPWQFNFLCGWQQVTLDVLEKPELEIDEIIKMSIGDICAKAVDVMDIIRDKLLWCFSCILYADQSKDVKEILELIRRISGSSKLMDCFHRTVLRDIQEDGVNDDSGIDQLAWQVSVACEHELLFECASFNYALVEHVKRKIAQPLFKIVFFLEQNNAWNSFFSQKQCKDIWREMFSDPMIFDVRSPALPEPNGVESCRIDKTLPLLEFPFFNKLYGIIEKHLKDLMADAKEKLIAEQSSTEASDMATKMTQILLDTLPKAIKYDLSQHVDEKFMEQHLDLYVDDLCNVFSVNWVSRMSKDARVHATRLLVKLQDVASVKGLSTNEQLSYWHISLEMRSGLLSAELQLLHMYQETTGNDCVQLLKVVTDPLDKEDVNQNSDNEMSIASEDFLDASEVLISELEEDLEPDQVSETSSFVSAFASHYGDGSVTTDEAEGTQDIPLKSTLVSHVCRSLLPTPALLDRCKGQAIWVRCVNNILLLAASIEVRPKELHYLHLCKDFVNLLALPKHLPDNKLATLGSLIADIEDNTLDSYRVFEFVLEIIQDVSNEDTEGSMQHLFLTKYFGRCLESSIDTPLLNDIFRELITEEGKLVEGSRPVLLRVILTEIEDREHESVYSKIIYDGVNPDNLSDNLVTLDQMLLELPSGENHHFAVLCCDLIEENGFHDLTTFRLMSGAHSSHIMVTSMKAIRVIESADTCSLQLVCALAFLNRLFRVFVEILIDNFDTFPATEEDYALRKSIRHMVESLKDCDRVRNVQLWFLRYISQQDSTNDVPKLMSSLSKKLEFLRGVNVTQLCSYPAIGFSPVSYMDLNGEITKALADLQISDIRSGMKTLMASLKSSPKQRVAFMAVLADHYYFGGKAKDLSDSKKSRAKWIVKEIEELKLDETPWCKLLKAVLGLDDFRGRMKLSKQSNISDVRLASVLLHMAAFVVGNHSGQQMSNFMQFLCPSRKLTDLHFPGASKASGTPNQQTRSIICKCSQMLVQSLMQGSQKVKCPTCGRRVNWPVVQDAIKEEPKTENHIGYKYPPVELWENLEQLGNISIISRLIIDFLVHGCLFIASEVFPVEFKKASVCSVDKLEKRLMKVWDALPVVFRAGPQDTCVLLHCIIKEISPMLTDTQYTFSVAAERDQQEKEIDKTVQKVLMKSLQFRKQFLQDSFEAFGTPVDESLQHQLQELDSIDAVPCKLVPRSMRQKRQPSLDDLKACFCDNSQNVECFPFLHLVLSQYNALKYVCYLPTLLNWNMLVSAQLSQQREKRRYAKRPISSLIEDFPNMSVPWAAFRDAAKKVCDGWLELPGETSRPDYITNDSDIIQCLMPSGKEQNTLKKMIKTLQEVQNSFLTQALEISATRECPAISFLRKENCLAALQTKALDQVGKKDIITNPWNDRCLCYNDINTEYGHGTEITYELNQIEMEVALTTVVNKMILTDGCALEGFIFADDLYHSSTTVLEELDAKVKQETLPKDIANLVIQGDRRKQGTFTNDLLQQLEVLMGLIKRTSGKPDETLQDFISEWRPILKIESPELFASIKLKHIVSLYQQLEVLLAAATVQTLGKKFQTKLPVKPEHELERCCTDRPGDALIQIRDFLKRFVFRYLRARQGFEPDCKKSLRDLMKDMTGHDRVLPLLHRDLQLCHIVKLLEFFDRKIKQKEDKSVKIKRKTTSKRESHTIGTY